MSKPNAPPYSPGIHPKALQIFASGTILLIHILTISSSLPDLPSPVHAESPARAANPSQMFFLLSVLSQFNFAQVERLLAALLASDAKG